MIETADERASRIFAEHRELLFSMVYNMLGMVADTEDVLQETWLSWVARHRPGAEEIAHPRAYLVRSAVNQALQRQAAISRRRETYIGPWLPEPLLTADPVRQDSADAAEPALRAESVSMAMLVVLETLTPLERAVFVLHEVFGYPHTEIAGILGRDSAAIRQLAHRAREHVHARRPRYQADPHTQRAVTEKFLAAQLGGDVTALLELLAPDVVFVSDAGGKTRAALRPIYGAEKIARLIRSPRIIGAVPDMSIRYGWVNGDPCAVVLAGGVLDTVVVLDIDPATTRIRGIYAVRNPDKLAHLGR